MTPGGSGPWRPIGRGGLAALALAALAGCAGPGVAPCAAHAWSPTEAPYSEQIEARAHGVSPPKLRYTVWSLR